MKETLFFRIKWFINRKIIRLLNSIQLGLGTKYKYRLQMGKKLNLQNPQDFNEKIQWLNFNWQHSLVVKGADKYTVREYIKGKKISEILNPLYGVYQRGEDIEWKELPENFVLKTNNGCGSVIIVKGQSRIDKKAIVKKLNKWLDENYSLEGGEFQYEKITPLIIAEKLIETKDNYLPMDYKVFCFNGEPKFISVINERDSKNLKQNYKKAYFDLKWNQLLMGKAEKDNEELNVPKKPENLDDIIEYAKILSEDFPFVRVDLYNENGQIIFGELTFTPSAGIATYYSNEVLLELGQALTLPKQTIYFD